MTDLLILCVRRISKMSDRKAVIKNADMSEEMQQDAVDCATQALEKYNIEKVCIISKSCHKPRNKMNKYTESNLYVVKLIY